MSAYPEKVIISGDGAARPYLPDQNQNGAVYVRSDVAENNKFWMDVASVWSLWANDVITHRDAMERIEVLIENDKT